MAKISTPITKLIFIGPQGSGKGTQADFFSRQFGVPAISTGDLFRDHIKQRTALGKKAKQLVDAGTLVSDELTNTMLAERLQEPDARRGYVLDGYPRTLSQAAFLDTIAVPQCVIEIQLTKAATIRRISRRRRDVDTGETISLDLLTQKQRQEYDAHPEKFTSRDDDTPSAITQRLAQYQAQIQPLLEYYRAQDKLISVDGSPSIEHVSVSIQRKLSRFIAS